ncbi:tetratricopeptide repeat protein [Duganella fentianensis]|nr:SEL1-like repeat protein [Duganella fentianensis]
MANREELGIIRGARAGDAACQLALGKLYLFGGASLPRSLPTALHWLDRAAAQQQDEAWMLIGSYIPYDQAQHKMPEVLVWYERAYEAGIEQAGLVLAQLVLNGGAAPAVQALQGKALQLLEVSARSGCAEAQWLLAQQPVAQAVADTADRDSEGSGAEAVTQTAASGQQWLARAADSGLAAAQYAVLEQAWNSDPEAYLERALPLSRQLLAGAPIDAEAARNVDWAVLPVQLTMLSRCAELLEARADGRDEVQAELLQYRELAAYGGDRQAQLALGLWFARMDGEGRRQTHGIAAANFKRAIRWLTLAGEQGLAEAWFALSRIYLKPEFSQRCVAEAQRYLERAADMGHSGAQLECGMYAWRNRRTDEQSDVRAAYWLQKAVAQGCRAAEAALARVAAAPKPALWAEAILNSLSRESLECQPLLTARLELACLFGLSRPEALLLDIPAADQGHCLVIDIRASYGRSKRRLVLLRTARERQALDRLVRLFEPFDNSADGVEGNYRQRLYRLKTWAPVAAHVDDLLAA